MKPRNRTIGPAHAIDEHVYELERVSGLPIRWAFAMLKLVADREGRFPWLPNQIKRAVLPYDVLDVNAVLSILERGGLVCRPRVRVYSNVHRRPSREPARVGEHPTAAEPIGHCPLAIAREYHDRKR
jgi:hypothetical protein